MEGRSRGPLLAEEMAFEWVCARRGAAGIILGEGPKGVDGMGAEEGVREAENYYAPSFRPCCPLIPFARRVGKVRAHICTMGSNARIRGKMEHA